MTTTTPISQSDSTNCNFSTTNIISGVESARYPASSLNTKAPCSSYRKNYIAWDNIERANKPKNYTKKTKHLGRNSQALLAVVTQKLRKKDRVILNHKYISTITRCEKRQNQNIIKELSNVLDIKYHSLILDNGKKHRHSYEFSLKSNEVRNTPDTDDDNTPNKQKITTCSIYRENNNIKIRSRANFVKDSSGSFSSGESHNTEPDNKTEGKGSENSRTEAKSNIGCDSISDSTLSSHNTNGFLGSGKYLFEVLDHLTDEMCGKIRARCGKNYTDKAIREIAKAVSRSKKGAKAFFYHIKGFIAYLSKILTFEKRDPVKISSTSYYITANQTNEEQVMRKQEKYLTDIEYSLQVSPEWHLKKKLAATLERSKAYNILTSYKSLKISNEGRAVITLNNNVPLSNSDKELILSQIQATHEKIDNKNQELDTNSSAGTSKGEDANTVNTNNQYLQIESLELVVLESHRQLTDVSERNKRGDKQNPLRSPTTNSTEDAATRQGAWGKIRESFVSFFGDKGNALDESWTSKLKPEINDQNKTIKLQAPTRFIKDWIENNYQSYIEKAASMNGLRLEEIKYGGSK